MFVDLQVGLVIEKAVYHMGRIADGRTDHFHPIGAVLIGQVRVKGHARFRPIAQIDLCGGLWPSSSECPAGRQTRTWCRLPSRLQKGRGDDS